MKVCVERFLGSVGPLESIPCLALQSSQYHGVRLASVQLGYTWVGIGAVRVAGEGSRYNWKVDPSSGLAAIEDGMSRAVVSITMTLKKS